MAKPIKLDPAPGGGYYCKDDPGELTYTAKKPRVSVTDAEAKLIGDLFAGMELVLEIGTGLGVATKAIAKRALKLATVDNDPWVQENVWPDLVKGNTNITCYASVPVCLNFDGAFIDGDHTPASVFRDGVVALNSLKRGAVLAFHDTGYPSVARTIEKLHRHTALKSATRTELPSDHGITVFKLA